MNKCNSVIELAKKGFHLNEHDTAIICGCVSHWYKVDDKTLIENPDMYQDCFAFSIAYRDNEGFEPNFSGPKEVLLVGGKVLFGRDADGLDWRLGDDLPPGKIPVAFWRPYLGADTMELVVYKTTNHQLKFDERMIGYNEQQAMSDIIEKEAAIHKAWVDLNGSLQNLTNPIEDGNHKQLVICTKAYERFSLGCYTNAIFTNDIGDDYWKVICTIKEFTSYCKKMAAEELRMKVIMQNGNEGLHYDNTAQQVEALAVNVQRPIFTQAMADAGKKVKVGMEFSTATGNYVALLVNEESVVFEHKELGFIVENHLFVHPINNISQREKKIDSVMLQIGCHPSQEFIPGAPLIIGKLYDAKLLSE
jgi:hypothetical protein